MNILDGGVTAPKGFFAAGIKAGIKKEKKDMAVVFSEIPCESAGVFTRNLVKAAPVKWDKQVVDSGAKCQAVIVRRRRRQQRYLALRRKAFLWLPPA